MMVSISHAFAYNTEIRSDLSYKVGLWQVNVAVIAAYSNTDLSISLAEGLTQKQQTLISIQRDAMREQRQEKK
jgi:hypothetical protein